ncbi:hypothetical protein CCHOA_09365 [Corynebacterium choanae]|uniref:Uncharacterized protein n=1 Tax=Corynebacterium choanae TaxID=1862358 RepID=A0A3G6J8D8_9CORY|nr:hypothetical protein CCHOA_09365 [Corynebacterium choanae]
MPAIVCNWQTTAAVHTSAPHNRQQGRYQLRQCTGMLSALRPNPAEKLSSTQRYTDNPTSLLRSPTESPPLGRDRNRPSAVKDHILGR